MRDVVDDSPPVHAEFRMCDAEIWGTDCEFELRILF